MLKRLEPYVISVIELFGQAKKVREGLSWCLKN